MFHTAADVADHLATLADGGRATLATLPSGASVYAARNRFKRGFSVCVESNGKSYGVTGCERAERASLSNLIERAREYATRHGL